MSNLTFPIKTRKLLDIIPGLDLFFEGVKNIEVEFDDDNKGKCLKIRPYRDIKVKRYVSERL